MQVPEPAQLEIWADSSKDSSAVQELLDQNVPHNVMQLLSQYASSSQHGGGAVAPAQPQDRHSLLLTLRFVRNLCAMGPDATKALSREGFATVAPMCLISLLQHDADEQQLVKANLQALANFTTASPAGTGVIWQALFPSALLALAQQQSDLHELLGCIMYRCVQASADAHADLLSDHGLGLLAAMVTHAQQDQPHLWLQLLLLEVCIVHGRLAPALQRLQPHSRAFALHLISNELEPRSELETASGAASQQLAAALWDLLLASVRAAAASDVSHEHAAVDGLDSCLKVVRAISGFEPRQQQLGAEDDVMFALWKLGLVPLLLALLRALPSLAKSNGLGVRNEADAPVSEEPAAPLTPPPLLASDFGPLPTRTLYRGYRSDLVAVLSNSAFGRPVVQRQISRSDGVELLLEQCQIDDDNPLVKEWALWGIRNLSADAGVQQTIRDLQVVGVAPSDLLQEAGYRAELNPGTKRPRVMREDGF